MGCLRFWFANCASRHKHHAIFASAPAALPSLPEHKTMQKRDIWCYPYQSCRHPHTHTYLFFSDICSHQLLQHRRLTFKFPSINFDTKFTRTVCRRDMNSRRGIFGGEKVTGFNYHSAVPNCKDLLVNFQHCISLYPDVVWRIKEADVRFENVSTFFQDASRMSGQCLQRCATSDSANLDSEDITSTETWGPHGTCHWCRVLRGEALGESEDGCGPRRTWDCHCFIHLAQFDSKDMLRIRCK